MTAYSLTAREAYLAGREDCKLAVLAAQKECENADPPSQNFYNRTFLAAMLTLWRRRIDQGDLPPGIDPATSSEDAPPNPEDYYFWLGRIPPHPEKAS